MKCRTEGRGNLLNPPLAEKTGHQGREQMKICKLESLPIEWTPVLGSQETSGSWLDEFLPGQHSKG